MENKSLAESTAQDIPYDYRYQNKFYTELVHASIYAHLKIHFNITITPKLDIPSGLLPSGFTTKMYAFLTLHAICHTQTHLL